MPFHANRCKETTTTTGTGTINLGGTATGYQTLVAGAGSASVVHYCINHRTTTEWEVGYGTVTTGTPATLSRTSVLASSTGSAIDFSSGTKDVTIVAPSNRLGITAGGFELNTAVAASPNLMDYREGGTVYTNEGATALNVHTLPTAVAGYGPFTFIVQDTDGIKVNANTGDTIRFAASVSSSAGYITSTTKGDSFTLYAINATEWYVIASVGAGITVA